MRKAIIIFILSCLFLIGYMLTPKSIEETSSIYIEPEVINNASE